MAPVAGEPERGARSRGACKRQLITCAPIRATSLGYERLSPRVSVRTYEHASAPGARELCSFCTGRTYQRPFVICYESLGDWGESEASEISTCVARGCPTSGRTMGDQRAHLNHGTRASAPARAARLAYR